MWTRQLSCNASVSQTVTCWLFPVTTLCFKDFFLWKKDTNITKNTHSARITDESPVSWMFFFIIYLQYFVLWPNVVLAYQPSALNYNDQEVLSRASVNLTALPLRPGPRFANVSAVACRVPLGIQCGGASRLPPSGLSWLRSGFTNAFHRLFKHLPPTHPLMMGLFVCLFVYWFFYSPVYLGKSKKGIGIASRN